MSVTINGRTLDALVYQVCELAGHVAPTTPQRAPVGLAGAPGVYGTELTVSPREVTVGLDVRPTTLSDRQTVMDTLRRRLGGLLELTTLDLPTRVLRCELQGVETDFYSGAYAQTAVYVRLRFVAVDPARWDIQPLTYGLSTARTACPVGTDTSAPVLELYGSCTNPAVTIFSHTGEQVAQMTFAATLGANDTLLIDCATQELQRWNAGVLQTGAQSGLTALTNGPFLLLSPEDADPMGTRWPTLSLSAASGTPTGLVRYFRRW